MCPVQEFQKNVTEQTHTIHDLSPSCSSTLFAGLGHNDEAKRTQNFYFVVAGYLDVQTVEIMVNSQLISCQEADGFRGNNDPEARGTLLEWLAANWTETDDLTFGEILSNSRNIAYGFMWLRERLKERQRRLQAFV